MAVLRTWPTLLRHGKTINRIAAFMCRSDIRNGGNYLEIIVGITGLIFAALLVYLVTILFRSDKI